ncbi:hypothetical protein MBANPS3_000776 [Mucor bainieri]
MKPTSNTKSTANTKSKAMVYKTKRASIITKKSVVKTKAVIYDSDADADDMTDEDKTSPVAKELLCDPVESFHISRGRKLSVGRFANGDAFVDIRESHPPKSSNKRFRHKKGICLTIAQWRKILGLIPEIEKAIDQIVPKSNT